MHYAPRRMHYDEKRIQVTFQNDSGCPNIDGVELDIVEGGGSWSGSKQTCGSEGVQAELLCVAKGGCDHFELDFNIGCNVVGPVMPVSCTCEPLCLVYEATAESEKDCDCCEGMTTVQLTITVTDAAGCE